MRLKNMTLACLAGILSFTSCEMKDELSGKIVGENAGTVELDFASIYNGQVVSRADEVTDKGTTTSGFNADELNVDKYTLVVKNKETQETVKEGIIGEMKRADGKLSFALPAGTYVASAYNYEGAEVNVSTRPYFMGQTEFTVQTAVTNQVDVNCKLACIEVGLHLTAAFNETFKDDYSIMVDNGGGASQTFTKDNIDTKYYFKVPEGKSSLTVSVKANTLATGAFISKTYVVTKPEDAEGGSADLEGGDSFNIELTPEGATDSHVTIGISVDLSFTEKGETIEVPADNIIFDDKGDGGDPEEPGNGITFEGLPATYTCTNGDSSIEGLRDVRILAPNGIKNLKVTISGEIEGMLGMVGLPSTFDICNMDDDLKKIIVGLGLITEEDYTALHAGTCTDYTFKLASLLTMVPAVVKSGTSTFNLSVSDGATTQGGDIIVNVKPKEGE